MKFVIRAIITTLLLCSEIGAHRARRGTLPGDNSDAENMSLQYKFVKDMMQEVAVLKEATVGQVSSVQILNSGKWELTRDASNPLGICQGDCENHADCASGLKCFQRSYLTKDPPDCTGSAFLKTDYCSRVSSDASMVEVTSSAEESAASAASAALQELIKDISDTKNVSRLQKKSKGRKREFQIKLLEILYSTSAALNKDIQILHTGLWTFNTFDVDHVGKQYLGICEGDCKSDDRCAGDLKCFQRPSRNSPNPPDCTGNPILRCNYCSKFQNTAEISDVENVSLQGVIEDLVIHTEDISDAENVSLQAEIDDLAVAMLTLEQSMLDLGESIDILNTGKWTLTNDKPAVGSKLGICQGDCDSDGDCAFDLKCFLRPKIYDPIPADCIGSPINYCGYCSREANDSPVLEVASE